MVLIFAFGVQPARTLTLVYLGVVGAVILAVANGANDIANSMGTSVGAGAYYCLYYVVSSSTMMMLFSSFYFGARLACSKKY